MKYDDYLEEIIDDCITVSEFDFEDLASEFYNEYEECTTDNLYDFFAKTKLDLGTPFIDQVTGNVDGSYYYSWGKAVEALKDAIFDSDCMNALDQMGYNESFFRYIKEDNPEGADVILRYAIFEYNFSLIQKKMYAALGKTIINH
jgi:hypothetical protein